MCGLFLMQLLFSLRASSAMMTVLSFFTVIIAADREQSSSIVSNLSSCLHFVIRLFSVSRHRVGNMVLVVHSAVLESVLV